LQKFNAMLTEELLRKIIGDNQSNLKLKKLINRKVDIPDTSNRIIILCGVRRCGKSTLLHDKFKDQENTIFLNFEDPRLEGFDTNDFSKLDKIANESGITNFVFDEIQNVSDWEKFARYAHDKGYNLFITGSNATMLSKELGTKLTGRYKQIELFPFSYEEYLNYFSLNASSLSFEQYLNDGGFPEYLENKDKTYLRDLLKDIIIRDISVRRNIRNENYLVRLAVYLLTNVGKEVSFNNLTHMLSIKSVRSTIDYCDFLKESYLIDFIPVFSFSLRQQHINLKKVYALDTGMARTNSLSATEDKGRILENAVFLHLKRNNYDISFYKSSGNECDFIVKNDNKVLFAIQVCLQINEDNLSREIEGLRKAINATGAENGLILTLDQDEKLDDITVIPVWKWMIGS
jgi:uncharacterized protein